MNTSQRITVLFLMLALTFSALQAQPLEKQGPVAEEDAICFVGVHRA